MNNMDEGMNLQGIHYNVPTNNNPVEAPQTQTSTTTPQEENVQNDIIANNLVENVNYARNDNLFSNIDFGPLQKYLVDDNITDISYSNGGQVWLKTLDKGVYRTEENEINDALIEKIAFQCSNVMGKTFNMAHPFLDSESAELRINC